MKPPTDGPADWVEAPPARDDQPSGGSAAKASRRGRALADVIATVVITSGGLAAILAILGIFVYLVVEVAPLFYSASAGRLGAEPIDVRAADAGAPPIVAAGVDEYMEIAYVLVGGRIEFRRLPSGDPVPLGRTRLLDRGRVTIVVRAGGSGHEFAMGTDAGEVVPVDITFESVFEGGMRTIRPRVVPGRPVQAAPAGEAVTRLAYQSGDDGPVIVAGTAAHELWLTRPRAAGGLFAFDEEPELVRVRLEPKTPAPITALVLDRAGDTLLVASNNGSLTYWNVADVNGPRLMGTYTATATGDHVTALGYLIGARSIVMGTAEGTVSVWMPLSDPDQGGDPRLVPVREFAPHAGAVTAVSPSRRDKGFVTADTTGQLFVHYSTSGETLVRLSADAAPIDGLMFSPKANGVVALDREGRLHVYAVQNEHPEATLQTLFTPVQYEGYRKAQHIWQSSSGSDEFEPKFGLWPLIFGTLKGTIYAMLLATPMALLGAIYTAMFMSAGLRAVVKPSVEIMAALPTVVLGFLAGLWFAPLLEEIFPGVAAAFWVVPAAVVVTCMAWQLLPARFQRHGGSALELGVVMAVIAGSSWLCIAMNDRIEAWIFGGDYKAFLQSIFGVAYDQRNALVIAFAMGIAVIPTIFSISEDSITNVPRHLIAGSLAMGATPWQTLWRLVLVSASPGLFSAMMIGFGRAVGETMIVLMATGNTPLMEMNLFNGFRTLSANIAVEMPEAPHGSTLYRLLFLSGLILFVFTSIVNTIAEIIRQRLRTRYSQF